MWSPWSWNTVKMYKHQTAVQDCMVCQRSSEQLRLMKTQSHLTLWLLWILRPLQTVSCEVVDRVGQIKLGWQQMLFDWQWKPSLSAGLKSSVYNGGQFQWVVSSFLLIRLLFTQNTKQKLNSLTLSDIVVCDSTMKVINAGAIVVLNNGCVVTMINVIWSQCSRINSLAI